MKSLKILSLLAVIGLLPSAVAAINVEAPKLAGPILPSSFVMPWFCLERCDNQTAPDFIAQVQSIADVNANYAAGKGDLKIDVVAFERYNLGLDGTLELRPTDLKWDINSYLRFTKTDTGIKQRVAMVSSFPYPPQILNWTRQLMANPKPFTDALIGDIVANDIDGVNIDLEPTAEATPEDALSYAKFLKGLNAALSQAPGRPRALTVAAANWSIFWNIPAIASALAADETVPAGYFTSMNTYATADATFETQLAYNMASFGTNTPNAHKFGILSPGLENDISNPSSAKHHFGVLAKENICQIAIWRMPFVDFWTEHLEAFGKRCFRQ